MIVELSIFLKLLLPCCHFNYYINIIIHAAIIFIFRGGGVVTSLRVAGFFNLIAGNKTLSSSKSLYYITNLPSSVLNVLAGKLQ